MSTLTTEILHSEEMLKMAESVLKDLFPYFDENSTRISSENLSLLHNKGETPSHVSPEIMELVLEELRDKKSVNRVSLLKKILYYSSDEGIKKATIRELVRLKTSELGEILSGYLKTHRVNTPSKVEAIRALGKVAIRGYLERK